MTRRPQADLKLFGSIGSDGMPPIRGSMVAFGNTLPRAREDGLEERGAAADGVWRPRADVGHVQACKGQYTRAPSRYENGCTV